MLLTVKYLGHGIGFISKNFLSCFSDKLYVNMKPLYITLHDNKNFHWNNEVETLFQQIKTPITKDVTLTLPNTNHSYFITVNFSLTDVGSVLFQTNKKGTLDNISYISRLFTTNEQKHCTKYCELIVNRIFNNDLR